MPVDSHAGSLPARYSAIQPESQNIVLTAAKKAEDSSALILRFYEWAGKDGTVRIRIPKGATAAELTNLLEDQSGNPVSIDGDTISVPTHPYEIVTVKIDYPISSR
jgi:alpha-mannosidase